MKTLATTILLVIAAKGMLLGWSLTASPEPEPEPTRPLVCIVFPSLPICQPVHPEPTQPIEPMPSH